MLGWLLGFGWGLTQIVFVWVFAFVGILLTLTARAAGWTSYGMVRSAVTTGVTLFLAWRYGFGPHGMGKFTVLLLNKYAAMALVAASLVPLLGIVMISLGQPGDRWNRARRLAWSDDGIGPVATILALALAAAGVMFAWTHVVVDLRGNELIQIPVVLILIVPTIAFLLIVPVFAVGSVFNAGNAHPILPPLAAPFLVIAAIVVDRFADGVIATPEQLGNLVSIAALVGVSVLSALEIRQLRATGRGFRSRIT
ncbi:hypothetical protein [Embleya sp. NBC_00896]|uniref:hypothetical protein n=1 Tax=Embleya sp. NBC_00896 TaxID=2975961 RepID=UPI00386925EA|nr:hypothetical protein OG928_25995 [Embleya sp. NBC_00896]